MTIEKICIKSNQITKTEIDKCDDNYSGGNDCDQTDNDNQDLAASGTNIGASVTESVSGALSESVSAGIADVHSSVTQVLSIRSNMMLIEVFVMVRSKLYCDATIDMSVHIGFKISIMLLEMGDDF